MDADDLLSYPNIISDTLPPRVCFIFAEFGLVLRVN